jgi:hypothetical protein
MEEEPMNQCPYCGKYLLEYEECNCGRRVPLKDLNTDPKSLSTLGKVILTAIIYPLIVLIIALIAASSNIVILNILSIACAILAAICIFISGVYVLVIPLPIITYYRFGTHQNRFPIWLRIVCGILALIFLFLTVTIFYFDELGIILY